jgi:putative radical SAM enzyme (TIGR03279 family)
MSFFILYHQMATASRSTIKKPPGIKIRVLPKTSVFFRAGMRPGDIIVSVNGQRVTDELDFRFLAAASPLQIDFFRKGRKRSVTVEREQGTFLDIEFHQKPVRRCANRCVFCFIDQMPPGLRRSLYIKDEDLSHSFLNGNYVTLTNATPSVLDRIVSIGLSPLFVSVHATDPIIRNRLLGIRRAPAILDQLRFLSRHGIMFHTQIVVCPGYNDGAVLTRTINDLLSLGPCLLSVAVVPVGLTRFRSVPLMPVDEENARSICAGVSAIIDRDRTRSGKRRVFCADELFLKAGLPVPPASWYGEYPQIENGVGLLRQLSEAWRLAKNRVRGARVPRLGLPEKRYLLLTSLSAYATLANIAAEACRLRPITVRVEPVINHFFGSTVTVAGLLTARDVVRTVRNIGDRPRLAGVLVPAVMFNYAGFTLDGYSQKRLSKAAGITIKPIRGIGELLAL